MKTSIKLLIASGGFAFVFFFIGILMLQKDLKSLIRENNLKYNYRELSVEKFDAVEFSSRCNATIIKGSNYKVEIGEVALGDSKPTVETVNGRLIFSINSDSADLPLKIRITAPALKSIVGKNASQISLRDFDSDTIHVSIENGGRFIGHNNDNKRLAFKTSGETSLEITKD